MLNRNIFKYSFVILWFSFLSCTSETTADNPVNAGDLYVPFQEEKCIDWEEINFEDFIISNNVWGKADITDYQQCISIDVSENDFEISWNWSWPDYSNNDVKAYPEIIYGWKPWSPSSTVASLPLAIYENKEVIISWDELIMQMSGEGNLAFDIWLTSSANVSPDNITRELMIWLDNKSQMPGGNVIKKVTVDNLDYDLYIADWSWTYIAFVLTSQAEPKQINLHKFLQKLVDENFISADEFLAAIEFGNEIIKGQGITTIKNYSININ